MDHELLYDGHRQVVDLVWCCQDWSFVAIAARYKGYRYPIEVIGTRCGCITVSR